MTRIRGRAWSGIAALALALVGGAAVGLSQPVAGNPTGAFDLEPGIYRIKPMVRSDTCVVLKPRGGLERDALAPYPCELQSYAGQFAFVPTRNGYGTIRPVRNPFYETERPGPPLECATVARAVLLGAPRIDVLQCDLASNPRGPFDASGEGQLFYPIRKGPNAFQFQIIDFNGGEPHCWDARDAGRGESFVHKEPCDDSAGQRFIVERVSDFSRWPELARWAQSRMPAAASAQPPAAQPRTIGTIPLILPPLPQPATPVAVREAGRLPRWTIENNVRYPWLPFQDIPGGDYRSFATDNDQGAACMRACMGDSQCRAMTWVRPGVQQAAAMCWLKQNIAEPAPNDATYSAIIRPPEGAPASRRVYPRSRPLPGINYYGSDYRNFATDDDRGASCFAACTADNRCRAASWVRPGVQGAQAMCWMKNEVPEPQLDDNVVSMVRG